MSEARSGWVVEADGVTKRYGERSVVDGLNLRAVAGEVHALLGPNGSGKTTTVRMMSTLLRPDSGTVRILGLDVVHEAAEVKRRIGLVGQFHAVDLRLTGVENVMMFARLHGLSTGQARRRAAELLERFGLGDAGVRQVRTYSGGMRRRLDLLVGLVVRPAVLFLDEPTTALDPRSRNDVYGLVREFVAEGTTVVLTTQYLDEADQLADRLTILDRGETLVEGTPTEIKRAVGEGLDVVISDPGRVDDTIAVLAGVGATFRGADPTDVVDERRLTFSLGDVGTPLSEILRALDDAGVAAVDIGFRRPSLDEAFLALTGPVLAREA